MCVYIYIYIYIYVALNLIGVFAYIIWIWHQQLNIWMSRVQCERKIFYINPTSRHKTFLMFTFHDFTASFPSFERQFSWINQMQFNSVCSVLFSFFTSVVLCPSRFPFYIPILFFFLQGKERTFYMEVILILVFDQLNAQIVVL